MTTELFDRNEVYVGRDFGGVTLEITPDLVATYIAGTGDDNPWYHGNSPLGGPIAPALILHSAVFRTQAWYLPNIFGNLHARQEWQGFAPNATTPSTVKITDLWDPDGSKGINAVVIDSSGQWCIACQGIAKLIPGWFSPKGDDWAKLGVQMITLVIQNNNYEPATVTTAQQWRALFSLNELYVVADPADTFPTNALPSQLLVNPRTMKVVRDLSNDTAQTADGADPQVATLAMKNGGKK